jgi:hypothetical protein
MDRKAETSAVKRALISAGFENNNLRVKHGNGTAWGWLKVYADIHHKPDCRCIIHENAPRETSEECKELWRNCYNRINEVAIVSSGRSKYASEQIGIHLGFIE